MIVTTRRQSKGAVLSLVVLVTGCEGIISSVPSSETAEGPAANGYHPPSGNASVPTGLEALEQPAALGVSGLRRLSRAEIARTLGAVFGIDLAAEVGGLPADPQLPFDNDYTLQSVTPTFVESALTAAESIAAKLLSDPTSRGRIVTCAPSGADDVECFHEIVSALGRRLFRRPIGAAEVEAYDRFLAFARADQDFDVALRLTLEAMLQDPTFFYRIEVGEEVISSDPTVVRLDSYEVASRLSFLLWGQGPDDALLAEAAADELSTRDAIWETSVRMLEDERAYEQVERFHAMYLGYGGSLLPDELRGMLRAETDDLVDRVVFGAGRRWSELFTSSETHLSSELARHYGLAEPSEPTWTAYPDPDKRGGGLLSHGIWLSLGARFGDTSPTVRGKEIVERFLCWDIPPPPPNVNADEPPPGDPMSCKLERYTMSEQAECASCHSLMDPIGFGLENYGPAGEWRDHVPGRPDCAIDGQGDVRGAGAFRGAAELGAMLVDTGDLEACLIEQLHRFAAGRPKVSSDDELRSALEAVLADRGSFLDVFLAIATSEGFRHRVMEDAQ